jgi:sulfatase modifying factor 1
MKRFLFFLALCSCTTFVCAQTRASKAIDMIDIPAGHSYMGSDGWGENYDEAPVHRVDISKSFRISKTEITNAQYEAFDSEHRKWRGTNGLSSGDDEAVIMVSYKEATDFCEWLSRKEGKHYRLPTEAEWEYVCRAGTYTPYYCGDALPSQILKNQTTVRDYKPVSLLAGATPPNAFGVCDMHGNVEEWCLDWYGTYPKGEVVNPRGPHDGLYRITRGGSHNTPTDYLHSANRMAMIPEDKSCLTGFRIVEADMPLAYTDVKETTPLCNRDVAQQSKHWNTTDERPFFDSPIPYVIPPSCESKTPFYHHNHQPALTWCPNGDLLAIWFTANHEEGREVEVLASRLRSGKSSWDEASSFYKVPDRNMTGSALLNDGKGTLYHINGVEAAGSWQNLAMTMRTSTDNGAHWSRPRIIEPIHTKRHQVIAGTIQTSDGRLVQLCDAGPEGNDGSSIHISKDGGKTWCDLWDGSPLPHFGTDSIGTTIAGIHAGIVELKDGTLMTLGRGCSIAGKDGEPRMPMSLSTDGGKTWHYYPSEFTPIDGGQRLVLMRLRQGPLLLISFTDHPQRTPEEQRGMLFRDKTGKVFKGYGMFAALSYDEGKTWPVKKLMTDGKEHLLNGGAWTGFFLMDARHAEPRGYLAGTQTPDGIIHLVSSRLYYRFNLSWLTN